MPEHLTMQEVFRASETQPRVLEVLAASYGVTPAQVKAAIAAGRIAREDALRRLD